MREARSFALVFIGIAALLLSGCGGGSASGGNVDSGNTVGGGATTLKHEWKEDSAAEKSFPSDADVMIFQTADWGGLPLGTAIIVSSYTSGKAPEIDAYNAATGWTSLGSPASGAASIVRVVTDDNGFYVAAWSTIDGSTGNKLYHLSTYTSADGWSPTIDLASDVRLTGPMTVGPSRTLLFTGQTMSYSSTPAAVTGLFAQTLSGGHLGTRHTLSGSQAFSDAIRSNSQGEFHIIWDAMDTNKLMDSQFVSGAGWGTDTMLADSGQKVFVSPTASDGFAVAEYMVDASLTLRYYSWGGTWSNAETLPNLGGMKLSLGHLFARSQNHITFHTLDQPDSQTESLNAFRGSVGGPWSDLQELDSETIGTSYEHFISDLGMKANDYGATVIWQHCNTNFSGPLFSCDVNAAFAASGDASFGQPKVVYTTADDESMGYNVLLRDKQGNQSIVMTLDKSTGSIARVFHEY